MANKFLLAILPFLFLIQGISIAQQHSASVERQVGVVWSPPDNTETARQQLNYFSTLGIEYLQVDEPLTPTVRKLISKLNFKVYALLPVRFPVTPAFGLADSASAARLHHLIKQYSSRQSVTAIGIFAYGPVQNQDFQQAVSRFTASFKHKVTQPIYYITSRPIPSTIDNLFNFKIVRLTSNIDHIKILPSVGGYYLPIDEATSHALSLVKHTLKTVHRKKKVPVFFKAELLIKLTNKFPRFEKTLSHYITIEDYPIPAGVIEPVKDNRKSLITILLLLSWLILSATYYISPVYRRSFYRYFTGHQFFLTDVFERHIRSILPGGSILMQQIILTGIAFFCIGNNFITALGKEALMYHYPILSVFGATNFAFLFWGFAVAIIFEAICICWLLIANPKLKYFSQVINLYPWLLQLNIVVVTVMLTVYSAGWNQLLLFITGILFLMITLAPFIVASIDAISVLQRKHRIWVTSSTFVLYIILLTGILIWIYLSPQLLKVLELALTL